MLLVHFRSSRLQSFLSLCARWYRMLQIRSSTSFFVFAIRIHRLWAAWSNRPLMSFLCSLSAVSKGISSFSTRNRSTFSASCACSRIWEGRKPFRFLFVLTKANLHRASETGSAFALPENTPTQADRPPRRLRAANRLELFVLPHRTPPREPFFSKPKRPFPPRLRLPPRWLGCACRRAE